MTDLELFGKLQPWKYHSTPKIVCLCGSTKFKEYFELANRQFTLEGVIVLSVGFFMHSDDRGEITPKTKERLDFLHLRKIDLANSIYVINYQGYIGESTSNEIAYAHLKGKEVMFMEKKKLFVNGGHYAARVFGSLSE